ncbi:MAG: hypothetical protein RMX69_00765 [Nostoc sp. EspVER01]|nr:MULTISPECIES: hypothetical protein [unclassified Nostoc]MDZ7945976.1 hypothetical protein [Nostoc sp. EfeVER01]MDZ7990739.1 hypothetical protein [Nostoc sp. EspVER01]
MAIELNGGTSKTKNQYAIAFISPDNYNNELFDNKPSKGYNCDSNLLDAKKLIALHILKFGLFLLKAGEMHL